LSGKSHLFDEATRLNSIKQQVAAVFNEGIVQDRKLDAQRIDHGSLSKMLDLFPAHYLLETSPIRIADDVRAIRDRKSDEILVEATYDLETETSEYRIIAHEDLAPGCFHKVSGILSAKRMTILSAAIFTTQDGVIIDVYRVRDSDHSGEVPKWRIDEVAVAIRKVLRGEANVDSMLKSRGRFAVQATSGPVSDLPMRVVIDNESSDRYTVIDVFAHDRPGLLYTITRTIYELKLSVFLAKIATHFDQVLDVFFVTEANGTKVSDGDRLKEIRDVVTSQLNEFEKLALANQ
jgi:[protein-PII] uridylyltransferase